MSKHVINLATLWKKRGQLRAERARVLTCLLTVFCPANGRNSVRGVCTFPAYGVHVLACFCILIRKHTVKRQLCFKKKRQPRSNAQLFYESPCGDTVPCGASSCFRVRCSVFPRVLTCCQPKTPQNRRLVAQEMRQPHQNALCLLLADIKSTLCRN